MSRRVIRARRLVGPLVVAFALVPAAGAMAAGTRVSVFHPWNGASPAIKVSKMSVSSCGGFSRVAVFRNDAVYCQTGSSIADPCFISPADASLVLCPNAALTSAVEYKLFVSLRTDPRRPAPSRKGMPFNVQITGGAHCNYIGPLNGPQFVNNVRSNYTCSRHRYLWGRFDTRRSPWSAVLARDYNPIRNPHTRVLHVWH